MQSHRRLWVRRLLREVEEEGAAAAARVRAAVVVVVVVLLPRRDDDYRRCCCCWPHLRLRRHLRREYELSSPNQRTRECATQLVHHHHHSAVAALAAAVGVLAVEEDGLDAAVAVVADVARRVYV